MIHLYENKNQILNDSIDRIVVDLISKKNNDDKAQLLLLTGCSTLSGTTTISIALAIAIANTNRRVLLVDCDVRKSKKYKKLNESIKNGLADYLTDEQNKIKLQSIVQDTNIDGLKYIPCGSYMTKPTRVLCSPKMNDVIENISKQYDFVIFDVPSISIVPDANILFEKMDGIVLLAALGETTKTQIKQAKRKISKYSDKYFGMIVNKVDNAEFRKVVRNYDYYFADENGGQQLSKRIPKDINIKQMEE